jgi:hypothetical protein
MFSSHSRLDGGCAAEEGRSSSSLARLLPLLLGPTPRFADDILERSGGLLVFVSALLLMVKRGSGRCSAYEHRGKSEIRTSYSLKARFSTYITRREQGMMGLQSGVEGGREGVVRASNTSASRFPFPRVKWFRSGQSATRRIQRLPHCSPECTGRNHYN